ncbi:tetratricopeptide repeat protein [Thioclava sp. SK-1]|uniref:tetratricopeptide repeat protein n=1 Tax=Thioclava sp. SK-1 TaxID=1889770 RepID=UPI001C400897|nr:tetratricopeptide repeat protein [Thioclava sp. SK-1]
MTSGLVRDTELALGQICVDQGDAAGAYDAFAAAARAGDPRGYNMLGRYFQCGWGGSIDGVRAAQYFRKAAELGDVWALFNLADLHLQGLGVSQNPQKALGLYRRAAEHGLAKAQNMLGIFYETGQHVSQDLDRACDLFDAAAKGGDCWGFFNLGRLFLAEAQHEAAQGAFRASLAVGYPGYWHVLADRLAGHDDPALVRIGDTARAAARGEFDPIAAKHAQA